MKLAVDRKQFKKSNFDADITEILIARREALSIWKNTLTNVPFSCFLQYATQHTSFQVPLCTLYLATTAVVNISDWRGKT